VLTYGVITPVRNEERNLRRLGESLAAQTIRPSSWTIVDTGSTDDTRTFASELEQAHGWVLQTALDDAGVLERGGPIARAFEAGYSELREQPDIVVKVDADVSFDPDYFERLLARFDAEPSLGMASGSCFEQEDGVWRQRFVTGSTVWGAARAYRRECLDAVLPLERRMGWDGVDEFRANVRGWETRAFTDLPFRHHRKEGARDGSARKARFAQGRAAHYLGYRFWYLTLRALWHARTELAALAMIAGFLHAAALRQPRCGDDAARRYLRSQQSPRRLSVRLRQAAGR
jgi:poly-beta-1,6-N-acetyl-D-glucosamine synthase